MTKAHGENTFVTFVYIIFRPALFTSRKTNSRSFVLDQRTVCQNKNTLHCVWSDRRLLVDDWPVQQWSHLPVMFIFHLLLVLKIIYFNKRPFNCLLPLCKWSLFIYQMAICTRKEDKQPWQVVFTVCWYKVKINILKVKSRLLYGAHGHGTQSPSPPPPPPNPLPFSRYCASAVQVQQSSVWQQLFLDWRWIFGATRQDKIFIGPFTTRVHRLESW